jgi:hypothetical protein
MSKITITVSGPVGVGKSAICARLEILLKHLGADVEWVGGKEEANLTLEEWTAEYKTPIEIVEKVESSRKVYETYTGQNGWLEVSQEEYDRTKHLYVHRIRRVPDTDVEGGDAVCVEADGCPTERAVLQRFWRAHGGRTPQLIDQKQVDELLDKHSEWTPYGFAVVDSHRNKLVTDLLALTTARAIQKSGAGEKKFTEQEPVGFMMKHRSGGDRGFSWKEDDAQFSKEWRRIGMYSEGQVIVMLREAGEAYDERAKKWRESFDAMHRRTMSAERQIAESNAILDRVREAIQPQAGAFNTPTIPLEEAMKYAAPQGQEAGK